jgi:hypothetical protein
MLSITQKKKLNGKYDEDDWKDARVRANFNKNMRRKLKQGVKELSDLTLLLKKLPPQVLENAKLAEDMPEVVEFVDVYLEKVAPHPVGKHESGETRVFYNLAVSVDGRPDIDDLEKSWYIQVINGKKYRIVSDSWKASPGEIGRHELLTKHAESIQKYIYPGAVSTLWDGKSVYDAMDMEEMKKRSELLGAFQATQENIMKGRCIPTIPPSEPKIFVEKEESK